MTKEELRKIYRQKRKDLTVKEIERSVDLMLINFQQVNLPFISCVHTYIASCKLREADTSTLVRYLKFKNPGMKVLVPKIDVVSGNLQHFHFTDDVVLVQNSFGIGEPQSGETFSPAEIDLVLVPLLAFDKRGYRVGYGKGYYDKFLSACRQDALKVGLSFFGPEEQVDNISQFDIPLNYVITPQQVFEFY